MGGTAGSEGDHRWAAKSENFAWDGCPIVIKP